jgi:hypothetical protein
MTRLRPRLRLLDLMPGISIRNEMAQHLSMAAKLTLTSEQLVALREIAGMNPLKGAAPSFASLGVLLRLGYVRADDASNGYAVTETGRLLVSRGL